MFHLYWCECHGISAKPPLQDRLHTFMWDPKVLNYIADLQRLGHNLQDARHAERHHGILPCFAQCLTHICTAGCDVILVFVKRRGESGKRRGSWSFLKLGVTAMFFTSLNSSKSLFSSSILVTRRRPSLLGWRPSLHASSNNKACNLSHPSIRTTR